MKKSLRTLVAVMLTLMMAMPLVAVAEEKEPVKLTFSHYYTKEEEEGSNESKVFRALLAEYQEQNPHVELDIVEMNNNDYQTKLPAQAAADDLPDIFCTLGSWIPNFADSEMLADLAGPLKDSGYFDSYRETIFDPVIVGDSIYGTPLQFSASGYVYYNADLWKQAGYDTFPTTWEEVLAAKAKFDEMGVYTFAQSNKGKWNFQSCWMSTIGDRFTGTDWTRSIIARDGNAKFTDKDFVDALTCCKQIADAGVFNPDFNALSTAQAQQLFAEGKAATLVDGYWALPYLQENAGELLGSIKMALLPNSGTPKGESNSLSGGGGWYLSVNNKLEGAAREEAIKLALYLTGPEFSTRYAEQFGGIGAIRLENPDLSKFDTLTQEYLKVTESAVIVPIYDAQMDASVIDVMNNGLQELLSGTKSPEDLAAEIQSAQDMLP